MRIMPGTMLQRHVSKAQLRNLAESGIRVAKTLWHKLVGTSNLETSDKYSNYTVLEFQCLLSVISYYVNCIPFNSTSHLSPNHLKFGHRWDLTSIQRAGVTNSEGFKKLEQDFYRLSNECEKELHSVLIANEAKWKKKYHGNKHNDIKADIGDIIILVEDNKPRLGKILKFKSQQTVLIKTQRGTITRMLASCHPLYSLRKGEKHQTSRYNPLMIYYLMTNITIFTLCVLLYLLLQLRVKSLTTVKTGQPLYIFKRSHGTIIFSMNLFLCKYFDNEKCYIISETAYGKFCITLMYHGVQVGVTERSFDQSEAGKLRAEPFKLRGVPPITCELPTGEDTMFNEQGIIILLVGCISIGGSVGQGLEANLKWWNNADLRRQITTRSQGVEYVLGSALDLMVERLATEMDRRILANNEQIENNEMKNWIVMGSLGLLMVVGMVMMLATRKYRMEKEREMALLKRRFQEIWGGRADNHLLGQLDRNPAGGLA